MPLHEGTSGKTVSGNIKEMMDAGYSKDQAVAASLNKARDTAKKRGEYFPVKVGKK